MRPEVFSTERLLLCPWADGDAEAFRPIATDPEVMRFITGGQPWPDERIADFIARQRAFLDETGACRWKLIEKASCDLVGFCGPGRLAWLPGQVEIGWWLARSRWGRGLATEAARVALEHAVRTVRPRLISVAHPDNHASTSVMRKLGLRFERMVEYRGIEHVQYATRPVEPAI